MSMVFSSVFSFYFSLLYNVYLFNAIFFSFAISWLMLNSFLDILLQHVRTACNLVLLNRHRKGQNPFTLSMTYLFVRCMVSSLFSLPAHTHTHTHSLSASFSPSSLSVSFSLLCKEGKRRFDKVKPRMRPRFPSSWTLAGALIKFHKRRVQTLLFHPNNSEILISGDKSGEIGVWNFGSVLQTVCSF